MVDFLQKKFMVDFSCSHEPIFFFINNRSA